MSRLLRFGRYVTWSALDQFIELGLPRLALYPILLEMLGKDAFGSFVLAMSLVRMVGLAPCTGLSAYVIREGAHHEGDEFHLLMRTVIVLGLALVVPIGLIFALGAPLFAAGWGDPLIGVVLPGLAVFLLSTNLVHTATAAYRYRRQFGKMAALHAVLGLLQFLAIPFLLWAGASSLGWAYAIAGVIGTTVMVVAQRRELLRLPVWTPTHVRGALRVWWPVSLSAALYLSAGYLDRVMIGWWWRESEVAVFFAAAATARLLTVPVGQLSILVFSLLGRYQNSSCFSRRFYVGYLAAACGGAVILHLIGAPIGRWMIGLLYHKVATEASSLWGWTLAAAAVLVVQLSVRPFVNKFLPPRALPWLAASSAAFRLIPLLLLVPSRGALGAAQAMFAGGVFMSLSWASVYVWCFVLSDRPRASGIESA